MMKRLLLMMLIILILSMPKILSFTGLFVKVKHESSKLEPRLRELAISNPKEKIRAVIWFEKKPSLPQGKIIHKFKSIPAVVVYATPKELEEIGRSKNVKKIVMDRKLYALRDVSIPLVRANLAYSEFGVNGTGINVSVVDSGVFNHSEFQNPNRIILQKCYCCDSPPLCGDSNSGCCPDGTAIDENATDDNGHGTHCAGIAAGKLGVANASNIIAVKTMNSLGNGWDSDVAKGIEWAFLNGANVISLSLGICVNASVDSCYAKCYDSLSATMVENAVRNGTVVIAAAGNCGPGGSPGQCPEGARDSYTISTPGCAKNVITVGASDDGDAIASFSSRGPTDVDNRTKPDLTAPGVNINSTLNSTNGYGIISGTSQATPHVAGVVALLMQKFNESHSYLPEPGRVKAILLASVNTTGMNSAGYEERNNVFGSGRIDAYEALRIMDFVKNDTISQGEMHVYKLNVSGDTKVSLVWVENESTYNDLDLMIGNSTNNFTSPTSQNDTVEEVFLYNPIPGLWNVYVNGTNVSSSQEYYLASNMQIFSEFPQIAVESPLNKSYNFAQLDFNMSVDRTLSSAWVLVNGTNYTLANDTLYHYYNVTVPALSEGFHNATFYANSSDGMNQTTVYFTVDLTPPIITIESPISNEIMNYSNNEVWFNLSTDENCDVGLFSLDAGLNESLNKLNSTYFFNLSWIPEGFHNVTFYLNDSAGNWNSSVLNFSVMIKPNISDGSIDKPLILRNETVNVSALVSDENLDKVWLNITWPDGMKDSRSMKNSSSLYFYEFNETSKNGTYSLIIFANDSYTNKANVSLRFEVGKTINFSCELNNGSSLMNASVKVYYNGTSKLRNESTNSSFEFLIPSGFWDLNLNTSSLNVSLFKVNLTQNESRSIRINDDVNLDQISESVKAIKTVALKFLNFSFEEANLFFTFNSSLVSNASNLEVYECSDWNFSNSSCETNWINDSSSLSFNSSISENNVSIITSNFSAFSLGEATTSTTSSTTTSTTTTIPGGSQVSQAPATSVATTSVQETTSSVETTSTAPPTTSSAPSTSSSTTSVVQEKRRVSKYFLFLPVILLLVAVILWLKYAKTKPSLNHEMNINRLSQQDLNSHKSEF